MLLVGRQEGHPACKNWVAGCWRGYLSGARCRLAYGPAESELMPLPPTGYCFSKIQIGFYTFLVPAHPGSPGQRAVKRVCVWCQSSLAGTSSYFLKRCVNSEKYIFLYLERFASVCYIEECRPVQFIGRLCKCYLIHRGYWIECMPRLRSVVICGCLKMPVDGGPR